MAMILGPTASEITLTPDYGYSFSARYMREANRGVRGNLSIFVNTVTFTRLTIPLNWVSSGDRCSVNSWWSTGTTVHFLENDGVVTNVHTVRLMGSEEPFQSFVLPYAFQEYGGELLLESV